LESIEWTTLSEQNSCVARQYQVGSAEIHIVHRGEEPDTFT